LREDIFDLFIKMGKLGKSTLTSEQTIQRMEPSAMQQSQVRIRQALVVGLSCSFLVSVSLALLFSNDIIRRLRLINENAAKLGRNECLNPLLKPGDEIADLDQAIHESQNLLGQARMRERAILDNSLDLLCSLSPDLQIVAVGTAAEKLLGLQLKDIQGQDVTKFLAGNSQNFKASCKTLIQSDEDSAIEVEAAISANTGARASNGIGTNPGAGSDTDANTSTATSTNAETISMLWTIRWSVNARILYCVARDISREKELEAMKQRLLAIVSHDIRTPLSSVINALSNLRTRSEIAESEASLKLDHCQNQLKKLLNSLEEFLDMQRIERGKLQMNMTCVSAVDLLVCAIDMLSILASEKKIDIQLPVGDAAIAGDEKRLIQTVAFFLKQAIASSGPGSAVRTSIELLDQPGADKKFVDLAISFFPRDSAAARMFMDSPAERLSSEALNREATVSDESAQSLQFTIVEYVLRAHNGSFKIKKNKQQNQETICLRLPLYDSGEGEDE
jgi:signal transduction histidine kinase